MQIFDNAPEQLRGEDGEWDTTGRTFFVRLLDNAGLEFDPTAETVEQVLGAQEDKPGHRTEDFAVRATSRPQYGMPTNRLVLFFVNAGNDATQRVLDWKGPALLFEREIPEEQGGKRRKKAAAGEEKVLAVLDGADRFAIASGEGLVTTFPMAAPKAR